MRNKIHFFDLDGTLWKIHSSIYIIDKNKPQKPLMKLSMDEFNLIKNGVYIKDNIVLDYNGSRYFISEELFERIKKKSKSENIERFGISFIDFVDKQRLNNAKIDFLLDNIEHLRNNTTDKVAILTGRSNKRNLSDILNKLRIKLEDMGISLYKIIFVGDRFLPYTTDYVSYKKVENLIEHLIGFKVEDGKFTQTKQDWFQDVYFYDDDIKNINNANNVLDIISDIILNTEDKSLLNIIKDRLSDNKIRLINNLVTNNELNRFSTNVIDIDPIIVFSDYNNIVLDHNDVNLH
jgi:hypothetical protein